MELEAEVAPCGLDTGKELEMGSSCPRARRDGETRGDGAPWLGVEAAVVVRNQERRRCSLSRYAVEGEAASREAVALLGLEVTVAALVPREGRWRSSPAQRATEAGGRTVDRGGQ
ncbi:hypothetical protein E2562_014025 [Oryza meyeriana var. granulata]|uniref:Uncharacterized protein n=1 Tax=Oryza meyeriana var. granulata TaxID=110450 RepID=A0A6G1DJ06_9ORYZ|nr:hypothetical protein E2562_014025 [Oryza meyeriana var. granulata]